MFQLNSTSDGYTPGNFEVNDLTPDTLPVKTEVQSGFTLPYTAHTEDTLKGILGKNVRLMYSTNLTVTFRAK